MPTPWELENCPHFEITSDAEWDPKAMHFHQDSGDSHQDDLSHNAQVILAYDTQHQCPDISPETLSRQWGIGIDTVQKTLKAMTQAGICHVIHPLH